ncbi:Nucleotidylyl transferase [Aulographum hederae CBS 113979]|uniref:choline-phosphate cytidylyltransferase n=1 Tax=Aulographum hederae CBS 113979 TaxID=1176131 RepID=A0A6G1H4U8_9PEZI|nr:Nucleotidylyl transferase [Aulographum hederae CBS 113979]
MSSKRKRASTLTNSTSAVEVAQPSSRDASGEDAEDPVLQEVSSAKRKASDADPPAKRTRSSRAKRHAAEEQKHEFGPERDQSSSDAEGQAERDKVDEAIEHGENGERGTMGMEPPPPAGQVDPVGYKTNPPPTGRPVRVYADGVFDLFHLGHMRVLQQAKTAFPDTYLIVGVTGDKETHRRKGLTVLSGKERAESVRHCKWVDEVIEDCPWIIADAPEFIKKHRIDYIAHDDLPYGADEGDDIYRPIKEAGMFLVTQRTEGVSTTGVITKIVRDYDQYIARQLKRGTPRQELNVSWVKKNELDIKRNFTELRNSIKSNWTTTGQELGKELKNFWSSSRPASPARGPGEAASASSPVSPRFGTMQSPSALAHLSHLDIPRATSANGTASADFAAGYSLGLIGGVRSWMARSRRTLNDSNDSRPHSPDSGEESSRNRSPEEPRGRQGRNEQDEVDAQMVDEMLERA